MGFFNKPPLHAVIFLAATEKKYTVAATWNVTFAEFVLVELSYWKLVRISFPQGKTQAPKK